MRFHRKKKTWLHCHHNPCTNFSGQKSGDVDPGDLDEQHPGLPQTSNHPQCKEQYKVGVDMDFEIDCNIDLGHNLGV